MFIEIFQFSSVTQSCLTFCDPMDYSMPGLPVHHQLPEFTQTYVHWVGDAIPTISSSVFPFSSYLKSFPESESFQVSQLFASVLELQLQHQSLQWTPRTDLLYDGLVGSLCSPMDSQEFSPTPQFKSINSSALSFLYNPTLTSVHDYWKNHDFA